MTDSASASPEREPAFRVPCGLQVQGRVSPPSSKSITHRYLLLGLLGRLPLVVERPLVAEDTRLTLAALTTCGFRCEPGADEVRLEPGPLPAGGEIHCGNAGTLFRLLVACLTVVPGRWRVDGSPRLRERPIGPLLATLRALGAEIHCQEREGFAPLEIHGGSLRGGTAELDAGESSQYLSAVLLAAQRAPAPVEVHVSSLVSAPYLDLTRDAVRRFGGAIEEVAPLVYRVSPAPLRASRVRVETDFSAACYPAAAAALAGGPVTIAGVRADSRQGDRGFFDLLSRMGAVIEWAQDGGDGATVRAGRLEALRADLSAMPDQVPTLAALAPFARGTTHVDNVAHLRIKESDRLAAMARELGRLGVPVEERPDGLSIPGIWADGVPPGLPPVTVHTYDDHRIAMSLALVGLRRPGVSIAEPGVVAKSYPEFWRDLEALTRP